MIETNDGEERERDGLSTNNEESFWLDTNSYTQLNIHKRKGERVRERERNIDKVYLKSKIEL